MRDPIRTRTDPPGHAPDDPAPNGGKPATDPSSEGFPVPHPPIAHLIDGLAERAETVAALRARIDALLREKEQADHAAALKDAAIATLTRDQTLLRIVEQRLHHRLASQETRFRSLCDALAGGGNAVGSGQSPHQSADLSASFSLIAASALFDPAYYAARCPDVAASGLNPLIHYLTEGAAAGIDPHPLFDTAHYRARQRASGCPDLQETGGNPLLHYLRVGAAAALDPHPLFDTAHYAASVTAGGSAGEPAAMEPDPLSHFLHHGALRGYEPHPLFDTAFYQATHPDIAASGLNPLIHYMWYGVAQGYDPHPLFDTVFYVTSHPDSVRAGDTPLAHYLRHATVPGHDPNPLFDTAFYLERHPDAAAAGINPLVHYLRHATVPGHDPHALFDTAFYLERHPDVAAAGINPLVHYLRHGAAAGRDPNPLFSIAFYTGRYPDAVATGLNPLVHYLHCGAASGHDPHPLFNTAFYLEHHPDAMPPKANPLAHYLRYATTPGHDPGPLFDTAFYLERHPDVAAAGINPLIHYLRHATVPGHDPNPLFDTAFYLRRYPDVAAAGIDPLVHYLLHGAAEGRAPGPGFDVAFYLERHRDVAAAGINPLVHYLWRGRREHRAPVPSTWPRREVPAPRPPVTSGCSTREVGLWETLARRKAQAASGEQTCRPVDVVVPVYGHHDDTLLCLHSVLTSTVRTPYRLVVVDDASPEPDLARAMDFIAGLGLIELVRNERNLGFVQSVNRGMALHPDRDVVLLNSDTEVFDGWLDRLHRAARLAPDIATVTPLTNNGEICSYPRFRADNTAALEIGDRELAGLAAEVNDGMVVPLPTGVGFCFYVKRACLDDVGLFDADRFGRGYGEENDFCLRASRRGWRHLLAGDAWVRHSGGVSFGAERGRRIAAALETIRQLYPHYPQLVQDFADTDPPRPLRERIDAARFRRRWPDRAVLLVTHNLGGGTERHVAELSVLLDRQGIGVLIGRPGGRDGELLTLEAPFLDSAPNLPRFDVRGPSGDLADFAAGLGIRHIHVHHLAGFADPLMDAIRKASLDRGLTYDVTVHDYMAICPRINLVDASGAYCGEPGPEVCALCLSQGRQTGSGTASPDPSGIPKSDPSGIMNWRSRHARFLSGARRVFAPSRDTATRIARHVPGLHVHVVPHPEHLRLSAEPRRPQDRAAFRRRVAVIGAVGRHKGADVLLACARDAADRALPLEFVVFGHTACDGALNACGNTRINGTYREEEIDALLQAHDCDVAWFPAVWPETYSYTLSIALRNGLFPIAFDLGAVAERIRASGWGRLVALGRRTDPAFLNTVLLSELPLPGERAMASAEPDAMALYYRGVPALEEKADGHAGIR